MTFEMPAKPPEPWLDGPPRRVVRHTEGIPCEWVGCRAWAHWRWMHGALSLRVCAEHADHLTRNHELTHEAWPGPRHRSVVKILR